MTERAISFSYRDEQLYGILHEPERSAPRRDLGFVFPHSGSRGRLGNTFHYRYFARELARAGYPVVRFDPPGLGDSQGTIATVPTYDLYSSIQSGRYVGDTLAAVGELRRLAGPRKIALLGVCGGAFTALAATAESSEIAGAALLSLPVILDSADTREMRAIPPQYARRQLSVYRDKVLSPKAWWRLATGKSDTATIGKWMSALFGGVRPAPARTGAGPAPGRAIVNPRVVAAARTLAARACPVLVIYGQDDRSRMEFERELATESSAARWERHVVDDCNHMFTMREWQERALAHVTAWAPQLA